LEQDHTTAGMGNKNASHGFEEMADTQDSRILMVGLDGAGKTSMLHRMKQNEVVSTVPTIGFNVETVQFRNMNFNVWDVGSQNSKIRALWRRYFENAQGLIFVVDSTDHARMEIAKKELTEILAEKSMRNTAVLVLANKQDLPQSMSENEVAGKLGLLERARCVVKPVCAVDVSGLSEALDWLAAEVAADREPKDMGSTVSEWIEDQRNRVSPARRTTRRLNSGGDKGIGKQSFL